MNPRRCGGFTLIELVVVIGILLLLLAVGVAHIRNSRYAAMNLTETLGFHLEAKKASEALREAILEGTEVVKPVQGFSLPYLVLKDLTNRIMILYFEEVAAGPPKVFQLVSYLDEFTGSHVPGNRKVLIKRVKTGMFTCISPGLAIAQLTLLDERQKELTFLVEVPMKNFGSSPDE